MCNVNPSTSKMDDATYSLEQRVCLYDSYIKTDSAKLSQKLFNEKYPTEIIPSKSAIHKLVKNVRRKGKLLPLKKKPRQNEVKSREADLKRTAKSLKHATESASKCLEEQLQSIRKKVLADRGDDVTIKSELVLMEETEDSPSEDLTSTDEEMPIDTIKVPEGSSCEDLQIGTVKQELEEDPEDQDSTTQNKLEDVEKLFINESFIKKELGAEMN